MQIKTSLQKRRCASGVQFFLFGRAQKAGSLHGLVAQHRHTPLGANWGSYTWFICLFLPPHWSFHHWALKAQQSLHLAKVLLPLNLKIALEGMNISREGGKKKPETQTKPKPKQRTCPGGSNFSCSPPCGAGPSLQTSFLPHLQWLLCRSSTREGQGLWGRAAAGGADAQSITCGVLGTTLGWEEGGSGSGQGQPHGWEPISLRSSATPMVSAGAGNALDHFALGLVM